MSKTFAFLRKHFGLILVTALILAFFFVFYFNFELNFKINGDFYLLLGAARASWDYLFGHFQPAFFPDALTKTPDVNFLSFTMAAAQFLTHLSFIKVFMVFSVVNIIIFCLALYYFLGTFKISYHKRSLIILLFFLFAPLKMDLGTISSSLLSIPDILINAPNQRLLGFALLLILFRLTYHYFTGKNKKYLIIIAVLTILTSSIHILSFAIYFFSALILAGVYLWKRQIKIGEILLWIFVIFISIILLIFSWRLYSIPTFLYQSLLSFQVSDVARKTSYFAYNNIEFYINTLSFALIGYLFLRQEKNLFLKVWIIVMSVLIIYSIFVPWLKIPMFWRFVVPLKIALIAVLVRNFDLSLLKNKVWSTVLILFITLNILNGTKDLLVTIQRPDSQYTSYKQLEKLDLRDGLILSDDRTSNVIQGIPGFNTLFIPTGHIANKSLAEDNQKRLETLEEVLKSYNFQKINDYLVQNNIKYIVLNKDITFSEVCGLLSQNDLSYYRKIFENDNLKVVEVEKL
jgi:hypothetical protein